MARWIKTDTTEERVKPDDEWFTCDEMQRFVGGFFEAIQLTPSLVLYFNEDGTRLQLPINALATTLLHRYCKKHSGTTIVGNALIASLKETGDA